MGDIRDWSPDRDVGYQATVPAPDGCPELTVSSRINNTIREVMAAVRRQWVDKEWFDFGDDPNLENGTTFSVPGDRGVDYHLGRRVRVTELTATPGTLYGTIASVTGTDPTTVELTLDSGTLTFATAQVALGAAVTGASISPDSIATGAGGAVIFAAEKTSTQGIPPAGAVVTNWTDEYADTDSAFDPVTGVWTCPADGTYHLYAAGGLGGLADNNRIEVSLQVDGVTAAHARAYGGGASNQVVSHVACIRPLTSGQAVQLFMDHTSGLTPNMYTATPGSILIGGHKVSD